MLYYRFRTRITKMFHKKVFLYQKADHLLTYIKKSA